MGTIQFKYCYKDDAFTLTVFFSLLVGGGCCGVGTMMGGDGV